MLSPEELLRVVETMYPLLDELNAWITNDLIRRLMARMGRQEDLALTATDQWQLQLYKEAGGHYEALRQEIRKWTQQTDAEIAAIFEDAGIKAWAWDDAFYVSQGMESTPLLKSERLMAVLEDAYRRTGGEIRNFTQSAVTASQQHFIQVCDKAHLKVLSGAQSYSSAVAEAVQELATDQAIVQYASGHVDTIETAVLRAVRTGTAQASGAMSIQGMEERGWDVILVSAHLGARYGDGGENASNHAWWQGKLYSRTGATPDLPLFDVTGYGTGEGLCGWNCRHSFGPGNVGHNPYEGFDSEENAKAYDLSQKQRDMERAIRKTKTELIGYRTAIDECTDPETQAALHAEYDKVSRKLKQQNSIYDQFCEENGLKRYSDRLNVAKWDRNEARRAAMAAKAPQQAKEIVRDAPQNAVPTKAPDNEKPIVTNTPEIVENPTCGYEEVTQEWLENATPNSHEIVDVTTFEQDGKIYTVDGADIKLEYSPHEKEVAELLESKLGGDLRMMPKVRGRIHGVHTPDYLFRGKRFDLKTPEKNKPKIIFGAIHHKREQADNFVIDISLNGMTYEEAIRQIEYVFNHKYTGFVDTIIIIREKDILGIFRRK